MEVCDFMNATEAARNFIWHVFCDHYLEAAKTRLYGEGDAKTAAQWTMAHTIKDMLKLMAPVTPHITEEIYRTMYDADNSINVSEWPKYDESLVDEEAERIGDMVIEAISSIRNEKNKQGVSLNKPVKLLTIYAGEHADDLKLGSQDIMDTLKVESLEILSGEGGDAKLENYESIGFTMEIVVES